jgi:hypothetical protein
LLPSVGQRAVGATATASALLEVRQTTYAAALAYRLTEGRAPLDVVGGVRYLRIEAEARIDGSFFALSGNVQRSARRAGAIPISACGCSSRSPSAGRLPLTATSEASA